MFFRRKTKVTKPIQIIEDNGRTTINITGGTHQGLQIGGSGNVSNISQVQINNVGNTYRNGKKVND